MTKRDCHKPDRKKETDMVMVMVMVMVTVMVIVSMVIREKWQSIYLFTFELIVDICSVRKVSLHSKEI